MMQDLIAGNRPTGDDRKHCQKSFAIGVECEVAGVVPAGHASEDRTCAADEAGLGHSHRPKKLTGAPYSVAVREWFEH